MSLANLGGPVKGRPACYPRRMPRPPVEIFGSAGPSAPSLPSPWTLARLALASALQRLTSAVYPFARPAPFDDYPEDARQPAREIFARVAPLPFPPGEMVDAGSTTTVELKPQLPFKPDRFLIEHPENWIVEDIINGTTHVFVAPGGVPAVVLQDPTVMLDFSTVSPGVTLYLRLRNVSLAPQKPEGMVIGRSV
jgi:hypothetical protein